MTEEGLAKLEEKNKPFLVHPDEIPTKTDEPNILAIVKHLPEITASMNSP